MSEEVAKKEQQVEVTSDQQSKVEEPAKSEEQSPETPKEDDAKPAGDSDTQVGSAEGESEPPVKEKPEKPQLSDPEEPEDDVPIALVTGASGYLASHIIKQLLGQGRFRVRGTVRSLENEKKVKPVRELVSEPKYQLRLIEADLLNPKSWTEAVRRCSYVFHVASPLHLGKTKNPDAVIKPAVEGTTNVLKACSETGTVKRVVLTSSTVAIVSATAGDPTKPRDHVYTEVDWTNEATGSPYEKSKVRAEKAAWDLVKNLDDSKKFELVSVCPGLLEGPLLGPHHKEGSVGLAVNIIAGKLSRLPEVYFLLTDVRDAAAAHVAALERPEAAGNRYIAFAERLSLKEIAQILADEFNPQGYKIAVKGISKAALWATKFVKQDAKMMYHMLGKQFDYSNEKLKGELGVTPRSVKETLVDTGYSIIDVGILPKKPGYLGHPSTRPPPEEKKETEAVASKSEPAATDTPKESKKEDFAQEEPKPAASKPIETQESEPAAKKEEPPSEPAKKEEPPEEQAKDEQPPSELVKDEEPASEPAKDKEPPTERAKDEEPASEPAKDKEPPTEQAKDEEPATEPVKDEEPPTEQAKDEEPASEPVKDEEPPSKQTKDDEPASESVKDDEPAKDEEPPNEPVETQETATQDEVPESTKDEVPESTQDEEAPSDPDPASKPANAEESSTTETASAEQNEQSMPQDSEQHDEASKDADTES